MTTLFRSLDNPALRKGNVITIGNFDGVHVGHQRLFALLKERAHLLNTQTTVVTFEPHAFEFFLKDNLSISRLTRFREKFTALAECGIDNVIILKFNHQLASQSAEAFVKQLVTQLAPQEIIVGDDFRFGYERQGDFNYLVEQGKKYGFRVHAMPTLNVAGERVSSTRVRKALAEGDHELADRLLGHPYKMVGRIQRGDQLGRKLGFRTANIFLHRRLSPIHGIYIVYLHGIGDKPIPGVANVGTRPTVDGTRILLEVHLLNFDRDIYGRLVSVSFCKKIRDEARFPNLTILKEHIAEDVSVAKHYFKKQGVL